MSTAVSEPAPASAAGLCYLRAIDSVNSVPIRRSSIPIDRRVLAGRPGQRTAAQNVQVDVVDRLAGVGAGIHDDAESVGREAALLGALGGHHHQVAEELDVGGRGLRQ